MKDRDSQDGKGNQDRTLRELIRLAQEDEAADRARFDRRWDELSAGTLSGSERRRLADEAASSERLGTAFEGFRPVDDLFRARMVRELGIRLRHRRRRRRIAVGWTLAAAAVLVLAVGLRQLDRPADPVPPYAVGWEGGVHRERSPSAGSLPGEPPRLAPGIRFTLLLTPEREVAEAVDLRGFVRRGDTLRRWPEARRIARVSERGAIRISGLYGRDLTLGPGDWSLLVAVGRPGALPGPEEVSSALAAGGPASEAGWRLLRQEVRISGEP
jgi:hypothetical protein